MIISAIVIPAGTDVYVPRVEIGVAPCAHRVRSEGELDEVVVSIHWNQHHRRSSPTLLGHPELVSRQSPDEREETESWL